MVGGGEQPPPGTRVEIKLSYANGRRARAFKLRAHTPPVRKEMFCR